MHLIRCCCLLLLLLASNGYADSTSHKLNAILEQIKYVKELLFKQRSQQTDLAQQLEKTEKSINEISIKLQKTKLALEDKQLILNNLLLQEQNIKKNIITKQTLLLKQVRTCYLLGLNKNKLRLILEGDDVDKINRLLTYHRFLAFQNINFIHSLEEEFTKLSEKKLDIAKRATYLNTLKHNQLLAQKELDVNRVTQHALLKKISQQVQSHTDKLQELIKNKQNLEKVLGQLQKKNRHTINFLTKNPHQIPWPTAGRIIEKFGSCIQNSELKQNGVLIAAPEGQKVFAVAPGKVIFANWMTGYGLLLILDHGKGYMTLYGNNGVLYKKKGEIVANHELIATVGHTGGQQKSALYFALRNNGKAVDPGIWCH